jgi:hypothetical protein
MHSFYHIYDTGINNVIESYEAKSYEDMQKKLLLLFQAELEVTDIDQHTMNDKMDWFENRYGIDMERFEERYDMGYRNIFYYDHVTKRYNVSNDEMISAINYDLTNDVEISLVMEMIHTDVSHASQPPIKFLNLGLYIS